MKSRSLAKRIAELMLSKKASDVVILDVRKLTSITDYFIICSADSDTQVKAIADAIEDGLEKEGVPLYNSEGRQALLWVVMDYIDVVAHIFYQETRTFYNLERLWADAKKTHVYDKPCQPNKRKTKSVEA
ncbi:MAG: ribosome silencing factor [Bacteroidetes bacterium]|nr:ribosome silencing factor [Bacteroidota bacterium]